MRFSFTDLVQLKRDFNQIWPLDLVEDLQDKEPQLYQEYLELHRLISKSHQEEEVQIEETAPLYETMISSPPQKSSSLVTPGWNQIHKGQKNWADLQNLLFFYALGKLHLSKTDKRYCQKEEDAEELRFAIESLPLLKKEKAQTAEQRVAKQGTYLVFGKRVLDALLEADFHTQYDLERQIQDAEETNTFNAGKLKKSKHLAYMVFNTLKKRYAL